MEDISFNALDLVYSSGIYLNIFGVGLFMKFVCDIPYLTDNILEKYLNSISNEIR